MATYRGCACPGARDHPVRQRRACRDAERRCAIGDGVRGHVSEAPKSRSARGAGSTVATTAAPSRRRARCRHALPDGGLEVAADPARDPRWSRRRGRRRRSPRSSRGRRPEAASWGVPSAPRCTVGHDEEGFGDERAEGGTARGRSRVVRLGLLRSLVAVSCHLIFTGNRRKGFLDPYQRADLGVLPPFGAILRQWRRISGPQPWKTKGQVSTGNRVGQVILSTARPPVRTQLPVSYHSIRLVIHISSTQPVE